jgi:hypothetical protein
VYQRLRARRRAFCIDRKVDGRIARSSLMAATGFANATQRVQVTVGSRPTVEVPLTVTGTTGESITVVAEGGVEVNTQTQELSNVVSGTQLRELPNLTRDPYSFVGLSANVSDADPSARGTGYAINGQRAASTNILLDGADNNDVFTVGELTQQLNLPAGTAFTNLPAGLPAFGQVIYPVPNDIGGGIPQNTYQAVAPFDFNWTPQTQLYGRYALESSDFFAGTNSFSPFAGFNTGSDIFNNNFLLNLTHTFSQRVVSQSKFAFNRLNNGQPLGARPPSPGLYFFANQPATISGFDVALPGYLPFNPGSAIPFGGPQNLFQLYEDVNYTRGAHQFRFGGTFLHIQDNRTFGAYENAVQTLGTGFSAALTNLVQGSLQQFQVAIDPQGRFPGETVTLPLTFPNFSRSNRFNEWAGYAQDSWRVNPRLTLNLGLRYE